MRRRIEKKMVMQVDHEKNKIKNNLMRASYVLGVKEKTRLSLVAFVMLKTILPKRHKNLVTRRLIEPIF